MLNDTDLKKILTESRRIAVVGISPKPERPSYHIAEFLLKNGYEVVGVNPAIKEVLGIPVYPSLSEVPGAIDIVDVFRASDAVPEIADESIAKKAKVLWLQEGVTHSEAEQKAEKSGMKVIADRCILKEHRRLRL